MSTALRSVRLLDVLSSTPPEPSKRALKRRRLAAIRDDHIPCQTTFANFRVRIGESCYRETFHTLVSIVEDLGLLSFNILATDGTLFPSAARYQGRCCFRDSCASIAVDNIVQKAHDRIIDRIKDPPKILD